jgi:hypothetical protein
MQSRDCFRDSERFVRRAEGVMQNDMDFMDVIQLNPARNKARFIIPCHKTPLKPSDAVSSSGRLMNPT